MAEGNERLEDVEIQHGDNTEEDKLRAEEPEPQTPLDRIKKAFTQTRHRSQAGKSPARREMGKDQTKSLVLLAGAAVGMVLLFLGVFSSPQKPQKIERRRVTPDLGRRLTPGQTSNRTGSVTPVMDANSAGNPADAGGEQLTAADIGRTGRPVQAGMKAQGPGGSSHSLKQIDFSDPALQRQYAMHGYVPAPPPTETEPGETSAPFVKADGDLKKPSLVFVRAEEKSQAIQAESAVERQNSLGDTLPVGTRLVARLQAPVSTAVQAPVVAAIEYNYEQDGQIILPAGSQVIGKLTKANDQGYVSLHFDELELPDGTTEKIDAGAMGLDYKPLKGEVSGRKRALKFLVQSLTGVGEVAAYVVGGTPSSTSAFSESALLRERLASNAAMAGQNQFNELTYNLNIVVTVAGNTRFYLVLEKGATPAGSSAAERTSSVAQATTKNSTPSLQELRELLELKREMSQMYEQAGPSTNATPQP
jgi:Bacterial conjugation TrbI-like protein